MENNRRNFLKKAVISSGTAAVAATLPLSCAEAKVAVEKNDVDDAIASASTIASIVLSQDGYPYQIISDELFVVYSSDKIDKYLNGIIADYGLDGITFLDFNPSYYKFAYDSEKCEFHLTRKYGFSYYETIVNVLARLQPWIDKFGYKLFFTGKIYTGASFFEDNIFLDYEKKEVVESEIMNLAEEYKNKVNSFPDFVWCIDEDQLKANPWSYVGPDGKIEKIKIDFDLPNIKHNSNIVREIETGKNVLSSS